ncbi:MAG: exodeoxyribonuclease III [Hyphomicrobiales bacterium]|nr:exodeoxyribonuclease III [Hyphomicrobiales bacterium]
MIIASWNINSVRLRLPLLLGYLRETSPDVLCLQELKCEDAQFPRMEIEDAGYNCLVHGQKSWNGVAILSKGPLEEARRGLPGDENDAHARYLEATTPFGAGVLRVASIYLPNGNPVGTEKFAYKLAWMARLNAHARQLLAWEEPLVLAGDYNVMPAPEDVYDPVGWADDALFRLETREQFRSLANLGFTDALRAVTDAPKQYTFWDYQALAWQKNKGLRIDHLMLSPQAADRLKSVTIDKAMRAKEKPSDHVPIRAELA